MTTAMPVFASDQVRHAVGTDAVLSSLPLSYAATDDPVPGGVVVVDGSGDWPAATLTALRAGAAGVIVVHPGVAELAELRAALNGNTAVVIDSPWASSPVVDAAAQALRSAVADGSRLECRIVVAVGADLDRVLLDQLSLVRALIGPITDLEILHRSERGFVGEARTALAAVSVGVICSNAGPEHAAVRLLTHDGSVEVDIPSSESARPGHLRITDPSGMQLAPTLYESGHRATWRRLHRAITTGDRPTDLDGLEADIRTASSVFASQAPGDPSPSAFEPNEVAAVSAVTESEKHR